MGLVAPSLWDLPRSGIKPVCAGRFLTTGPLGKSLVYFLIQIWLPEKSWSYMGAVSVHSIRRVQPPRLPDRRCWTRANDHLHWEWSQLEKTALHKVTPPSTRQLHVGTAHQQKGTKSQLPCHNSGHLWWAISPWGYLKTVLGLNQFNFSLYRFLLPLPLFHSCTSFSLPRM